MYIYIYIYIYVYIYMILKRHLIGCGLHWYSLVSFFFLTGPFVNNLWSPMKCIPIGAHFIYFFPFIDIAQGDGGVGEKGRAVWRGLDHSAWPDSQTESRTGQYCRHQVGN